MNSGTSRSDEVFTAPGAVVIAGLGTRAGEVGVNRTAAVVREGDEVVGAGRVAVDDEGLGMVVVTESVDVCDVGSVDDPVARALGAPPAPAHPATTTDRAATPARDRAAYQRVCLTWTYVSEPTNAKTSTFGMMAW